MVPGSEHSADQPVRRGDHVMQGRLLLLGGRQPPPDGVRILGDDAPEQVGIAQGDSGEDVVARAALDQQIHHVPVRHAKHRGPPDGLQPVRVAEAVDVRARVEQRPHRLDVPAARRNMEGKRVVAGLALVGIRAGACRRSTSALRARQLGKP